MASPAALMGLGFTGQEIQGAGQAGSLSGSGLTKLGGTVLSVGLGVYNIAQGIDALSGSRDIGREGKAIAAQIASRARLEFQQRGVLASKLLASQRARFGAAGVAPSGTQKAVQEFTSIERQLERRLILNDALNTANRIQRRSRRAEKAAKRAAHASIGAGIGAVIGSFFGPVGAGVGAAVGGGIGGQVN